VVAAFFKAFAERFAVALLEKICCCFSWSSVSLFANRSSIQPIPEHRFAG
jgi:hypothetical protein